MKLVRGVLPAIVTPMNKDESLNFNEAARQVNRQIDAGVQGVFCLGTNGEFYALSYNEKIQVAEVITNTVDGRIPVFAGAGCITTEETISLCRDVASVGVDAISVIMPYFIGVSQKQIMEHYKKVADSVDIPILIYNIPMRTGNSIQIETVRELSKIVNIAGIKDSSGDIQFIHQLIEETADDFSVYVGTDSLILETLKAGGTGAVAGCANLFPGLLTRIYKSLETGEINDAETAQEMVGTIRELFKLGNPNSIVKRALNLLGQEVGPARAPADIADPAIDAEIVKALAWYRENGIVI